ncbi:hypothetical protein ACFSCX_15535 [Bacillus salitolerans]|uniref:YqzE family protein n=1 Tax=Bacillus salitolerans TaxID=1437434 RepID=A0ABW4LTI1_9BACI
MKEWWNKQKEKMRKNKKKNDKYTFGDFISDVLMWVPELILLPFRMIFWLFRGIIRSIFESF